MGRKNLIYQITERDGALSSIDYPSRTLSDWITRAEKRGEDVYKILTHDGFIVYEQYFVTREDGTQFLKKRHYLREGELTPKEAVTAMLSGEHLARIGQPAGNESHIEPQTEKPPVTWDDIIANFQKTLNDRKDTNGNDDSEKLAEFKRQIIGHLDNIDKKEKKSKKARKEGIKKQAHKVSYASEAYHIDDYMLWDDEIFAAVQEFYKQKSIYPNILLANRKTFAKIDEYVKEYGTTALVYEGDEEEPPEFDGLSEFTANDFSLIFCLDETIADDYFRLIYDNNPSFDGEEIDKQGNLFENGEIKHGKYSRYKLAA